MPLPYLYVNININLSLRMCHFRHTSHLPQAVGQQFGLGSFLQILGEQKKKKKPPPSLGSKDPRCLKPISQLQAFHTLMTSRHIFMDTHASNQKCIQRSFRKKKNQHEKKTMGSLFVEYQKTGDHQTFLKEKLASSSFQMLSYGLLLLFSQLCWIQDANTSRAVGENTHNLLDVFSTWKVRGQNESNLSRGRCRGEVRHCSNDLLTL